jgi:hypothetical protein
MAVNEAVGHGSDTLSGDPHIGAIEMKLEAICAVLRSLKSLTYS